jgi:hypothetical protein
MTTLKGDEPPPLNPPAEPVLTAPPVPKFDASLYAAAPSPQTGARPLPSPARHPSSAPSPGGSVRPPSSATPSGAPGAKHDSLLPPVDMGLDVEASAERPALRSPPAEALLEAPDTTPDAVSVNLPIAGREPKRAASRREPAPLVAREREPPNALVQLWQALRSWLAGLFGKLFEK